MNAPQVEATDSAAVLSVKIDNLTATVEHLRDDLKLQSETYVRKDVYAEKVIALDREIVGIKGAIQELKASIRDRRVPWTAVGSFVVAAVALAVAVLPKLAA